MYVINMECFVYYERLIFWVKHKIVTDTLLSEFKYKDVRF